MKNIFTQAERTLTVSVSSVIVHANFSIGCFSYKGLFIESRAAKIIGIQKEVDLYNFYRANILYISRDYSV